MRSVVQKYVVQKYGLLASLYGIFYGAGLAVLDLRIEWMMARTTRVQNPKEDREHMFIYPSIGSQVGVVKTIYYPRRGIYL